MADYLLSPQARRDLNGIRDYLSDAPESIRKREIGKLPASFDQAAQFRYCGRTEPRFMSRSGEVRSLFSYPYRIYYLPQTEPVRIVAVRHGRLEPPAPGRLM